MRCLSILVLAMYLIPGMPQSPEPTPKCWVDSDGGGAWIDGLPDAISDAQPLMCKDHPRD